MKRSALLSIVVLFSLILAAVPAPMAAQEGQTPQKLPYEPQRVPAPPAAPSPEAVWHLLAAPPAAANFTRFDGVFVPGPQPWGNKIYFMGGRSGSATEGPDIWTFDPETQQWADTTYDVVEDVSNYTANLIMDDGTGRGPAIYMVGGYNADGVPAGNIGMVQRFYPQVGVAEALPAADDWTVMVAANLVGAMGQAVVDDVIYVFGGWENIAAPYFYAGTWKFDPKQPSGSRWTDLGANLNPGRCYIQVAAQNGKIYAMGGVDQYVGGDLVPSTVVEALDTANVAAGWQTVAPLPVASGEGRGFGFDADTLAPAPWDDHIYLAGGGDWNGRSAESMEYRPSLNYWDQAFPDLNQARRDHAGVFVPLCTPDPDDGLPGLWVFGGNIATDAPPYGDPEYYPLECASACSVMLVDDDWDRGSAGTPNPGGRPYYTTALDALGRPYSLWDTVSQGTPTTADMAPYDVVVWFTGYDWENPVNAAEEAELIGYLGGGGRVLLSDQEQNYAFGLTPLMTNYFWVNNVVDDVTLLDPTGNAADPLFSGLGPYTMARPDLWYTYWPTETYEGPYDDEAYVKVGGFEPFIWQSTGNPNSTRFDSGTFKAIYLAWPFEWLPNLADRQAVLGTALDWLCSAGPAVGMEVIPPAQTGSGPAGATVPYTLTIINNLGAEESFDVTYTSVWPIDGPASVGPVPNGGSEDFVVEVTVPVDLNCYEKDTASVMAQAQSAPVYSDTAYVETSVAPADVVTLTGTIYDLNTGLGIPDAYVSLDLGGDPLMKAHAGSNGTYVIPDVPACTYNGRFNAMGYHNLYTSVTVTPGGPNTFDVELAAAMPDLSPDAVSVSVLPSHTLTYNMALSNDGTGDLRFHISEVPSDALFPLSMIEESMASGVEPQVYADLKAAPDGVGKFIVYLKDQADLSAAFGLKDRSVRGQYVLDALQATAQGSQASLRAMLDSAGVDYESRYIVNALVVEGNAVLVDSIAARPEVAFIGANSAIPAPAPVSMSPATEGAEVLEWNIKKIRADSVWTDLGVTGQGIVVSNIDTGVQYDHPTLVAQYRGNLGSGSYDHNYNWWDPYDQNPDEPTDAAGHGSHTMGTMVGSDLPADPVNAPNGIGVAPGAQWMACDGFDNISGSGYDAELLECAEFILAPWDLTGANPEPDMRPDVVNNSWGGSPADWWYNQAIYAWRAAGIFPSFSGGNAGPNCATVHSPSDMANVISAGATTSADSIASFSSRGPADVTGLIKPDVSAPGASIRSSVPGGYANYSGTSMASPHVAAEAALIWSGVPDLRGDVQLTYWLIEQSALPILDDQCGDGNPPNNVYGWGRIDARQAMTMALSANWDIPWLTVDPISGTVAPDASTTIKLTLDSTGLPTGECFTSTLKVEFNDPYVVEQFVPVEMCVVESLYIYLPVIYKNYP